MHFKHFYSINSFARINMYHFIKIKNVCHSNRVTVTDTNDAGDGDRDIRALVLLSHGDLQVTTFQAIPHMPHEMAWFNVSSRTGAAL